MRPLVMLDDLLGAHGLDRLNKGIPVVFNADLSYDKLQHHFRTVCTDFCNQGA